MSNFSDIAATADWRVESYNKSRKLYSNQGMHKAAQFLADLHPRAIEYLEQAPILVCTFGVKWNSRADRLYVASRIGGPIQRGEKLKVVMASAGWPLPFRKIKATALSPTCRAILRDLHSLDNSTLSQIIPDTAGGQLRWFSHLREWRHHMTVRGRSPATKFTWIASQVSSPDVRKGEPGQVADFLYANPEAPVEKWSWNRVMLEVELWHDRLNAVNGLKCLPGAISLDTVIDFSDWPETAEIDGFEIFKLATPEMIMTEGRRMRHCVSSYIPNVLNGGCSIFSIRREMRRMATVQVVGRSIVQIKGFANKAVDKDIRKVAAKFLESAA